MLVGDYDRLQLRGQLDAIGQSIHQLNCAIKGNRPFFVAVQHCRRVRCAIRTLLVLPI